MPNWFALWLICIGSIGFGACVTAAILWPWRTLAIQQARWIQAKQDMAATMVSNCQHGTPDTSALSANPRVAADDKVSQLYWTTLMRGWADERELAELAQGGAIREPVIQ